MNKAFLTGSHVYGEPTEDSDVDLVVFMDELTAYQLVGLLEADYDDRYESGSGVKPTHLNFTVGKLNIIACWDQKDYDDWVKGTEQLIQEGEPVLRERAVEVFSQVRYRPETKPSEPDKPCLLCGKPFKAKHKFNRKCPTCSKTKDPGAKRVKSPKFGTTNYDRYESH